MAILKREDVIEMMAETDALGLRESFKQLKQTMKDGWVGYNNLTNEELAIEYNDMFEKNDTVID